MPFKKEVEHCFFFAEAVSGIVCSFLKHTLRNPWHSSKLRSSCTPPPPTPSPTHTPHPTPTPLPHLSLSKICHTLFYNVKLLKVLLTLNFCFAPSGVYLPIPEYSRYIVNSVLKAEAVIECSG